MSTSSQPKEIHLSAAKEIQQHQLYHDPLIPHPSTPITTLSTSNPSTSNKTQHQPLKNRTPNPRPKRALKQIQNIQRA